MRPPRLRFADRSPCVPPPAYRRARFAREVPKSLPRSVAAFAAVLVTACMDRPLCSDCRPQTTNIFVEAEEQTRVEKIDLLFMIDNSASMADKQNVLAGAVPDLVNRLVTPNCVRDGAIVTRTAGGSCPPDSSPEFDAVGDIHVGVVTSSLGGHGGDNDCKAGLQGDPVRDEQVDDHAHLLGTRPRAANVAASASFDPASGFLAWNPKSHAGGQSAKELGDAFATLTRDAGESGCGYEAQLESVYRFLVDPAPPLTVTAAPCPGGGTCAVRSGRDDELLRERAAFLRPDSLLAVVLLTDENDCSIRDEGQAYYVATQSPGHMPAASAACAANPNDRCCYSCGTTKVPDGCPPDPACGNLPEERDSMNLRCFDQKRRFGYDFLYPTARYVNALGQRSLCTSRFDLDAKDPATCPDADGDQKPDVVPNPLFSGGRSQDLVFFAGIVGVPWEDIQATVDPKGVPYTDAQMQNELHYLTAKQLEEGKVWDTILGDPAPASGPPRLPTDGLMVESTAPRNLSDAFGRPIPGPNAGSLANPINGHDWANLGQDDLEYACIFRLPELQKDCANDPSCDCTAALDPVGNGNPLCQNPDTGSYGTTQFFAKAYPGIRELGVLRDFGKNAIVASICARELGSVARESGAQDYGYRPAVSAIVDRLKEKLGGRCLPRRLVRNPDGKYPCSILEAAPGAGSCDASRGRLPPNSRVTEPAREQLRAVGFCDAEGKPSCSSLTLCELQEAGSECHRKDVAQPTPGWCYVDPAENPTDDPRLVENCASTEHRTIRFVDPENQTPATGARVVIACSGADLDVDEP